MPLFYYDEHGHKIGPINKKELVALAEKGIINPDTRLTDDKIEIRAGNIPKLKFYAIDRQQMEEMFDPKNIDFSSMPTENEELPTIKVPQNTIERKQPIENNTPIPISVPQTVSQPTNINLSHQNNHAPYTETRETTKQYTNYWYFRFTLRISYLVATIIFYGGIAITVIATLISLVTIPLLSLIVLIGGLFTTVCLSAQVGIAGDLIQWLLNTEEHLKQIRHCGQSIDRNLAGRNHETNPTTADTPPY
jgi:hypothetical protein